MGNQDLLRRMLSTYNSLRFGMFVIAAATPIVIPLWGYLFFHFGLQTSISAYYFAPLGPDWKDVSPYPCRVLFTGILYALGSFLILYKGFSWQEDWALNLAGLFALGVAMCPMYAQPGYIPHSNIWHPVFAISMFICMAYTAIFCADDTLHYIANKANRKRYRKLYKIIGGFMGVFPFVGLLLAKFLDAFDHIVFFVEMAGIWGFAAYWGVKSWELKESEAELKIAAGIVPLDDRAPN